MAQPAEAPDTFRRETIRGAAGFFRVGQTRGGAWWLIDPEDRPFFGRAVCGVTFDAGEPNPVDRLGAWGFNALGPMKGEFGYGRNLPYVGVVNFCGAGALIRTAGVRLPDVFDPSWPAQADAHAAAVCLPASGRRELIGWLADDELRWGWPGGTRGASLLQVCLSLEPNFAAYHAAWEFVLAAHRGRLADVAKAWAQPITNKEVVREMTRNDQALATRGYLRDNAQWTREFAQRYFAATCAAIRVYDENHLLMGAGEKREEAARSAMEESLREVVAGILPAVELPWVPWSGAVAGRLGPVFASDFTWATPEFHGEAARVRGRGPTSVERMLRRGRAALRRVVSHPAVVGYAWRQWRDDPGEQPPFGGGLVHVNGVEAREHTELVADIHARAGSLRPSPAWPISP